MVAQSLYYVMYILGVGSIPVYSCIVVLNSYRSGMYLYVSHAGKQIPIIPGNNHLASITFGAGKSLKALMKFTACKSFTQVVCMQLYIIAIFFQEIPRYYIFINTAHP